MKEFLTSGKARIKCPDWVWWFKNTKPQTPKPQNTKHSMYRSKIRQRVQPGSAGPRCIRNSKL